MEIAIIIAFAYSKTNQDPNRHHLPGILIDIYHAYKYVTSLTKNIIVITDIVSNADISELKDSIINDTVDLSILDLLNTLRSNNQLIEYSNKKELLTTLKRNCHSRSKIFVYYTGHSLHGNILLPTMNNDMCYRQDNPVDFTLNFSIFRDALSTSSSSTQIMVVLDCCGSQGLHLNYKLQNGIYTLISRTDKAYPLQEIICFSSTMSDEVSIASREGSLFSYVFFNNLKKYRNIVELLNKVTEQTSKKFSQTPTVYSTYPDAKLIWRWLIHNDDVSVKLNLLGNYFIVKK